MYFPERGIDAKSVEFLGALRDRALRMLKSIIEDAENEEEIKEIENKILTFVPPPDFSSEGNEEVKLERNFETMCLFLSKEFGVDPKKFTTLEFYNAKAQFEKINKPKSLKK